MSNRIATLAGRLPEDIDAMLVQSPVNRIYLTGMQSSAGSLFVTRDQAYFIIDFRYIELARNKATNAEVILQQNLYEQLGEIVLRHGIKCIGVESGYLSVASYLAHSAGIKGAELVFDNRCNDIILDMRRRKDKDEIALMQSVQDIADKVFTDMLGVIRAGLSEKEVALEIYRRGFLYGAQDLSFSTIAVSGINSSMPHGVPSDKQLQRGDLLTMDFGYRVDGYCSDMTRTVAIGEVAEEQRHVYNTTLKAQIAALDAIGPGKACSDIDKIARDIIHNAGYEGCFGHSLGHSLGVEVHEGPRFRAGEADLTEPSHVISVEPGIYLEGRFGCRIEDVVCITEDGYINLTHSPKELIVL